MEIQEVKCKSIMSESGIYGVDYAINPYTGCEHGCKYCYATFMKKYSGHSEPWGDFVDVKTNADRVLQNDLMDNDKGSVLLSSVTDPYQPIEEEYELTRKILERLSRTRFPVNILTKSDLVLRDLDILKNFSSERISVGFTINYLDDSDRKIWEPRASAIEDRLDALKKISDSEIDCYVHIGPYFEGITDLEAVSEKVEDYAQELQIESVNLENKSEKIMEVLENNYPSILEKYKIIMEDPSAYRNRLTRKVEEIRRRTDMDISLFL